MRLRLFALRTVLFPGASLSLHVFEDRYKQMIGECLETGEVFGVALIAEGAEVADCRVIPHAVGSTARILDVQSLPRGRFLVSTVGAARFKIVGIVRREPYLLVEAELIEDHDAQADPALERLQQRVHALFDAYGKLVLEFSDRTLTAELPGDPQALSFTVADVLQVAPTVKQRLLEMSTTHQRLAAEREILERILPPLRRLLERRRKGRTMQPGQQNDGSHRPEQERFFGRYFSRN